MRAASHFPSPDPSTPTAPASAGKLVFERVLTSSAFCSLHLVTLKSCRFFILGALEECAAPLTWGLEWMFLVQIVIYHLSPPLGILPWSSGLSAGIPCPSGQPDGKGTKMAPWLLSLRCLLRLFHGNARIAQSSVDPLLASPNCHPPQALLSR